MQCPGGHLEYSESFADCAAREALEETGLEIGDIKFLTATNDIMEGKHYVTIYVTCVIVGANKVPMVSVLQDDIKIAIFADLGYSQWSRTSARSGSGCLGRRCGHGLRIRRGRRQKGGR